MRPLGKLGWAYESHRSLDALPQPQVTYNKKGGISWTTPSGDQHRFLDAVARWGNNGIFTDLDPATFHAILGQIYLFYNYSKTQSEIYHVHSKKHNYQTDVSDAELIQYLISRYDLEGSFKDVSREVHTMVIITNANQCWLYVDKGGYGIMPDGINLKAENEIFEREVFRKYMDRIWVGMAEWERKALVAAWKGK